MFFSHNKTASAGLSAAETISRTAVSPNDVSSNSCKYNSFDAFQA